MSADYSKMTNEEFESILEELVRKMTPATILAYGDVRTILGEELNNEVLDLWANRNKDKAFPPEEEQPLSEQNPCPECGASAEHYLMCSKSEN